MISDTPKKPNFLERITRKVRTWNSYITSGIKILKENKTNVRNVGIFVGSIFVFRTIYIKASPLRQRINK